MIMGNYLDTAVVPPNVMATDHQSAGMFHATVVPENFESREEPSVDETERE
ncbi:hypothetical protein SAMN05216388_1002139 [Halorientalis persicus]|uniref:Uncharacterized protein n=1 Tax=Halorientalis persicus TaxID=1367881 RepID=A0A1H8EYS8_9EURY|nr:hypothetical protein SAMN05216388_1002139 [Halorientalis persicus]